eukprot:281985_1
MNICIVVIMMSIISNAKASVTEFGFEKYDGQDSDNSGQDGDLTLTLYWNQTVSYCVVPRDLDGRYGGGELQFSCGSGSNDIVEISTNNQEEYKMKLEYFKPGLFRPTSLYVEDNGNKRIVDSFCGPLQYYYWHHSNPNPSLCANSYNRYNYPYLELGTVQDPDAEKVYLRTLYVTFSDKVPGFNLVSPAKAQSFSVKTANVVANGNTLHNTTLVLQWDLDLYLCSLLISKTNTLYTCYTSDTHCEIDPKIPSIFTNSSSFALFIKSDSNDSVYIDSVSVNDESNYSYSVNTFCIDDLNIIKGGSQTGSKCASVDFDGTLNEYEDVSIDPDNADASRITSIVFSKDLFHPTNYNEEGFVRAVSSQSLHTTDCNALSALTKVTSDAPTTYTASPTTHTASPTTYTASPSGTTASPTTHTDSPSTLNPTGYPTSPPLRAQTTASLTTRYPTAIPSLIPTISPIDFNEKAVVITTTEVSPIRNSERKDKEAKKDNWMTVIAVLSVVFGLVVLGVLVYFVYREGVRKGLRAMKDAEDNAKNGEESHTHQSIDAEVVANEPRLNTKTSVESSKSDSLEKMYVNNHHQTTTGDAVTPQQDIIIL